MSEDGALAAAQRGEDGMIGAGNLVKGLAWAAILSGALVLGTAYAQTAPAAPDAGQTPGDEATKPKPKAKPISDSSTV